MHEIWFVNFPVMLPSHSGMFGMAVVIQSHDSQRWLIPNWALPYVLPVAVSKLKPSVGSGIVLIIEFCGICGGPPIDMAVVLAELPPPPNCIGPPWPSGLCGGLTPLICGFRLFTTAFNSWRTNSDELILVLFTPKTWRRIREKEIHLICYLIHIDLITVTVFLMNTWDLQQNIKYF